MAANRDGGTRILATEDLINIVEDDVQVGRVVHGESPNGRESVLYEVLDFRKPDAIFIVQSSFETVHRRREEAAELFYRLLFEIDPGTRTLFSATDMRSQGDMLMSMNSRRPSRGLTAWKSCSLWSRIWAAATTATAFSSATTIPSSRPCSKPSRGCWREIHPGRPPRLEPDYNQIARVMIEAVGPPA